MSARRWVSEGLDGNHLRVLSQLKKLTILCSFVSLFSRASLKCIYFFIVAIVILSHFVVVPFYQGTGKKWIARINLSRRREVYQEEVVGLT